MLKRNLIANYLGQAWAALMGFLFVPLYVNYLGIESYALIGLFALLQSLLSLLDMGMTPTLGREMARFTAGGHTNESIRDLLRSIEIIVLALAMIMASGVAVGANWIANDWLQTSTLDTDTVAQSLSIMGLVAAFRFAEGVYRSAIIGLQRQVLFNAINSIMATLRGFGSVAVLAWAAPTLRAFFLWQGMVSIATLVALACATYINLPRASRKGKFSLEALRRVSRFAGGMIGITFLALLLTQVDKILLSNLLPLDEFGYYTLAATVATTLYVLIAPVTQAFHPKFCALYASNDSLTLADNYHKGAQLVSIIAGSVAMVLIFFSETILFLWTQDPELASQSALLLSLLTLGNLLNGLMWIPYQMQLAHGWTSLTVKVNTVAVAIIVPAILLVVPRYGAEGAAWVWVLLNAGYCLIAAQLMYRRILISERWRWYNQDVLRPLGFAGLGVGGIKYLSLGSESSIAQVVTLTFAVLAAFSASIFSSSYARRQIFIFLKLVVKEYHSRFY